jgi:hypothetical protein
MARPPRDLRGMTYDRLRVLERVGSDSSGSVLWKCLCSCNRFTVVSASSLTRGLTRSCGCKRSEVARLHAKTLHGRPRATGNKDTVNADGRVSHGLSKHPLYATYRAVVNRTSNPRCKAWKNYGARGITCDFVDAADFIGYVDTALGSRPPGMTLDRISPSDAYRRGNLRFLDAKGQARNRRQRRTRAEIAADAVRVDAYIAEQMQEQEFVAA